MCEHRVSTGRARGWRGRSNDDRAARAGSALYLNGELRSAEDLAEAVRVLWPVFSSAAPVRCLFIDEVTSVRDWQRALKRLIDAGELRDVLVVTTGSRAADLRHGGERLPGRKGRVHGAAQARMSPTVPDASNHSDRVSIPRPRAISHAFKPSTSSALKARVPKRLRSQVRCLRQTLDPSVSGALVHCTGGALAKSLPLG